MNQTNSRAVRDGLKYVHEMYGFLFERGYELFSAEDYEVGWQMVLRKPGLSVKIIRTRGDDYVSFRTSTQPVDEFFDIGSVVYAATGETIPLSRRDSEELQKYLDRIETYFEGEYVKNPESLQVAEKEYRATLPRVEITSPEEPKIIPILHYPLMVMVFLLLFGALATLYMVLLDRLFSTSWLDPVFFGLCTGAGLLLLAVGMMLLFWRQIKKR